MGGMNLLFQKIVNGKSHDDVLQEYVEKYWSRTSLEAQRVNEEMKKLLSESSLSKEIITAVGGIAVKLKKTKHRLSLEEYEEFKLNCVRGDAKWVLETIKKPKLSYFFKNRNIEKIENQLIHLLEKHFPDL